MVHQKRQGQLGSTGAQGSHEVSPPYHVRRKVAFIFYQQRGTTGVQKLIPKRDNYSYLVSSVKEEGQISEVRGEWRLNKKNKKNETHVYNQEGNLGNLLLIYGPNQCA